MRYAERCIMCGDDYEPRDADGLVIRCPDVELERASAEPVYLRELSL